MVLTRNPGRLQRVSGATGAGMARADARVGERTGPVKHEIPDESEVWRMEGMTGIKPHHQFGRLTTTRFRLMNFRLLSETKPCSCPIVASFRCRFSASKRTRNGHAHVRERVEPRPAGSCHRSRRAVAKLRRRHLVPRATVQQASPLLGRPSAPLLEEERDAHRVALVADVFHPLRQDGSVVSA